MPQEEKGTEVSSALDAAVKKDEDTSRRSVKVITAVGGVAAILFLIAIAGGFDNFNLSIGKWLSLGASRETSDPSSSAVNIAQTTESAESPAPSVTAPEAVAKGEITMETLDAIAALPENSPVRIRIFEECEAGVGVCSTGFKRLFVGWKSRSQFTDRQAFVCPNSDRYRRNILVVNPISKRGVFLPASGNVGQVGPCNVAVPYGDATVSSSNFAQLSGEHAECLTSGQVLGQFSELRVRTARATEMTPGCQSNVF